MRYFFFRKAMIVKEFFFSTNKHEIPNITFQSHVKEFQTLAVAKKLYSLYIKIYEKNILYECTFNSRHTQQHESLAFILCT